METISLKLDEGMLHNVDENLKKHNFSTRTEFIRDAIREKLEDLTRDDLMKEFLKFKGKAKKKVSDAELKKIREDVFDQIAKEKGWD
ncbi:ribbon-helix-helix domain-containing protein [Candidatus Woesearchaeota archaeon]|nr:ribbon-helix-helix domain-containing protein [Candidatus Woesearchaeota archaeon]